MLPATTDSETVWLKDVTGRFQTEKRTLSYPGLPDQLSFHIKGESHNVILNLERNNEMDPNADIYIVEKLDDGRSHLVKTENLETEDVAYYQDRENGAFVTARCVKRLNGQCDISIVNQLYRGIGDPEIEINVYIRAFLVFPWMANFPHFISKVQHVNDTKMIDANYYITDLGNWDLSPKEHLKLPDYDQVILVTR
ncbi:hypothetical protein ACJMK2_007698, partial [Sinanodonta woodiana]